jgi:hypothetical protein
MSLKVALWYFPVLMVLSGIINTLWDSRVLHRGYRNASRRFRRQPTIAQTPELEIQGDGEQMTPVDLPETGTSASGITPDTNSNTIPQGDDQEVVTRQRSGDVVLPFSVLTGAIVLALFFASLVVILVVRGVVPNLPTLLRFFANIYLAGIPPLKLLIRSRNHYIW